MRGALDPSRLSDAAERELHAQLTTVSDAVHAAMRADRYSDAMAKVVPLRPFVHRFFESVMAMAEDRALRENRVRLLMEIAALALRGHRRLLEDPVRSLTRGLTLGHRVAHPRARE